MVQLFAVRCNATILVYAERLSARVRWENINVIVVDNLCDIHAPLLHASQVFTCPTLPKSVFSFIRCFFLVLPTFEWSIKYL